MNQDDLPQIPLLSERDSTPFTRKRTNKSISRKENFLLNTKKTDEETTLCSNCFNETHLFFGRLENIRAERISTQCAVCAKKEHPDSCWIPAKIYHDIYKCKIFKKIRNDLFFVEELKDIIGNEDDIGNVLFFQTSEREILEIKEIIPQYDFDQFIFYKIVLNFMFPFPDETLKWCCWNFKDSKLLDSFEPLVKKKDLSKVLNDKKFILKRYKSVGVEDPDSSGPPLIGEIKSNPIRRSSNRANFPIQNNITRNEVVIAEKKGFEVCFGVTLKKGKKKKKLEVELIVDSIKSIPSLLYSNCFAYTRKINCYMPLSEEGIEKMNRKNRIEKLLIKKNHKGIIKKSLPTEIKDYQPCPECCKTSYIFPLFKQIESKNGDKAQISSESNKPEEKEIFYLQNKLCEVQAPFRFEFKLHFKRSNHISNFTEVVKNYTYKPFCFWNYYSCDSIMYCSSLLWGLNFIAMVFHVYPMSVVILMIISYLGYVNACQGSKMRPNAHEKMINLIFTCTIFPLYGILALIMTKTFALALLSLITFVAIFAGVAFYVALQSKNFRDIIISTFKGDPINKNYGISHFLKKLDRGQLMLALNRIYYQVQVCEHKKEKQAVLEWASMFSLIYIIVILVLTYVIEYQPADSLGSGDSYLIQNMGPGIYGAMFIFVALMTIVAAGAKMYYNLEITNFLQEIFVEFDRTKAVLDFFIVAPESMIDTDYQGGKDSNEIIFTGHSLNNNFTDFYKHETNRVISALQFQLREVGRNDPSEMMQEIEESNTESILSLEQRPSTVNSGKSKAYSISKNEKVTRDKLISWVKHYSKTSKFRLEYVDQEFKILTNLVRYKFLGWLEINSAFFIKFAAGVGTAIATSFVAVLNYKVVI